MKNYSFLSITRGILPAVLGALASVLLVALVTWAATTVGNNINTGGTLTVSGAATLSSTLAVTGASTLTGTTTSGAIYASSTVFADGDLVNTRNVIFGTASQTPTVTGFNLTGDAYITSGLGVGYATTSDGNLLVNNLLAVNNLLDVRGEGTSTFAGGISISTEGGLSTVSGITVTGGRILATDIDAVLGSTSMPSLNLNTNSSRVDFGAASDVVLHRLASGGLELGNAAGALGTFNVYGVRDGWEKPVPANFERVSIYHDGTDAVVALEVGGTGAAGSLLLAADSDEVWFADSGLNKVLGMASSLNVGIGSTTPYRKLGVAGSGVFGGDIGTSTLTLETSTASRSGCIELWDAAGARWIRMYPGTGDGTVAAGGFVASSTGAGLLVIEEGTCK